MLASEIREMQPADILARINELEEERFRLKFRGATENLEQPLRLRMIRKDVARLKTVLRERELGAATAAGVARSSNKSAAKRGATKQATATRKVSAPKKARTSSAKQSARTAAPKARKQER